jgi:Ca2+-binding EF-hand superfamily protein
MLMVSAVGAKKLDRSAAFTNKLVTQLQTLFNRWDSDKSGSVDKAEYDKFYSKWKVRAARQAKASGEIDNSGKQVDALFAALDEDRDSKVSKLELTAWSQEIRG